MPGAVTRPAARRLVVAALAAAAAGFSPASAGAATRSELAQYADRAAAVWAGRQDARGLLRDPRTGKGVEGYGNAMLGYALLRAGERRRDARLVRAGARAIATTLAEPPSARGVFDLLAVATTYDFARERLAGDPAVAEALPAWERYLRATVEPNIDNTVAGCIVAENCFHNHEAVGAAAAAELLATGLGPTDPGTRLADPAALRDEVLAEVGKALPRFAAGDAHHTGANDTDRDLALLSDTGNWPLAYHALSTAMLARAVDRLGDDAPDAGRAALDRTTGALVALMAPDGTVAYIGKRQESVWSLAATCAAAEIAAAHAEGERAAVYRAASDRALARMRSRHLLTPRGLPIVPRRGRAAFAPAGVDGDPMTFNGLALLLLNLAADAAPPDRAPTAPLPADADGAFVDRAQNGFAAVRHGDVWFAVHRHDRPRDVRNDLGLMAAKWRAPSGGWVDLVAPRPMRFDDAERAGPVVERGGAELPATGGPIAARSDGVVEVRGAIGGDAATFTWAPTRNGVRLTVPARAGDVVAYTAYLGASARAGKTAVADARSFVTSTPAPASISLRGGLSSCCDVRMVAARMRVPVTRDGAVSFLFAARPDAPVPAAIGEARPLPRDDARGPGIVLVLVAALGAVGVALVLRHRGRRRPPPLS